MKPGFINSFLICSLYIIIITEYTKLYNKQFAVITGLWILGPVLLLGQQRIRISSDFLKQRISFGIQYCTMQQYSAFLLKNKDLKTTTYVF